MIEDVTTLFEEEEDNLTFQPKLISVSDKNYLSIYSIIK